MSWFKRKRRPQFSPPTAPVTYPSGTCVITESGKYYLKGNKKYKLRSELAFRSWDFPLVCLSSDEAIAHYQRSLRPLGFRDGTVVRDIFNMELYVIADSKRVKITDPDMYTNLNLDESNIPKVSHEEIMFHRDGGVV